MADRMFMTGNEAVARGAIAGGCRYFFGYPITPQNDIPEFMSREMPKVGGVFVQSESEVSSIYMVYGGALAGARVMTSTSSPGLALMQEGISYTAEIEAPCVVVNVSRMSPGIGTGGQAGQTDYRMVVKGGGQGGYHCIVLAPWSGQEIYEQMQLAFHLADKYRILCFVLSDYVLGQMAEAVELKELTFEELPDKFWALKGTDKKDGLRYMHTVGWLNYGGVISWHEALLKKFKRIEENEVRYEATHTDDAELLLVSYGSTARTCAKAIEMARAEGMKVGLFRPITLWPYPEAALREAALKAKQVLCVEDSNGQMKEDVDLAVRAQVPVHYLGLWARNSDQPNGLIFPERVFEEIRRLL
ncbi:3-methyl-2-oxobutanoate dehydrogenase subunit VorB [Candidatus Poribacteria bacterium]|nr:3-methyl-2-oxobutanoate dehydrogenase subunit VorB [Candidatus Poribacteria bacterium]